MDVSGERGHNHGTLFIFCLVQAAHGWCMEKNSKLCRLQPWSGWLDKGGRIHPYKFNEQLTMGNTRSMNTGIRFI